MEKQDLEHYESPTTVVLEVKLEGVIAASDPSFNSPFNPEQNW